GADGSPCCAGEPGRSGWPPRLRPTIRATSARSSSVISNGPKPRIAFGAVKSQAFSDSPTKSPIFGSAAPPRRSAARVSSAGAPGARRGRISRAAGIVAIGGGFGGSNVVSDGSGAPGSPGAASLSVRRSSPDSALAGSGTGTLADFIASASSASRFRRDQRAMKFSGSLIVAPSASVRAAPTPQDRRGHARACETYAGQDARQQRRRSSRAPAPALAPRR